MKDLNSVQLIGRLGQDPNVQYTDTGTARTTFSVATNRTWTDADGQAQTETEWTRCATWGKLAEIAAQYDHKGSRVYVAGQLHTSRWEDAQTGEARSSVEIVVDDLILLDRPTPTTTPEDAQEIGAYFALRRSNPNTWPSRYGGREQGVFVQHIELMRVLFRCATAIPPIR